MAKSSQPALYEMMRQRSGPVAVPPALADRRVAAAPAEPAGVAPAWLSPGRSIRLPGGYIVLACGLTIILLTSAYVIGHKRGYGAARTEIDTRLNSSVSMANDPLALQPVLEAQPSNVAVPVPRTVTPQAPSGSNTRGWGPVAPSRDPRTKGMNYYILAEAPESGATLIAEFCRTHGLETYVVSGKNSRSRRVVAFPGFESSVGRTSQPVKAVEAQIHSVGEKWKKNKGTTDFTDAYLHLYGG